MNYSNLKELKYKHLTKLRELSSLVADEIAEDYGENKNIEQLTIKKSIKDYTSMGYRKINKYIRNKNKDTVIDTETENHIENISKAMQLVKSERLDYPFFVWRGLNNLSKNEYYDEIYNLSNTKISNNLSFLSTSYSKQYALNFNWGILLKIYIDPKEDLNYILLENRREYEFLFEPNTHFKYISEYMVRYEIQNDYTDNKYKIIEVDLKKGTV
jgi:hypothetical protein